MTNPNKTAIAVVVDYSSSMRGIANEAADTLNALIKDQKSLPGEATLRLTTFSDRVHFAYGSTDIQEVAPVKIYPGGMTALNDAIGLTIDSLGTELRALPESERPANVLVVIVTDGHENVSREYNAARIKEMVTEQQDKYNWQFTFIGANQDAVLTARGYGISAGDALTFNTNAASLAGVSTALRSKGAATRVGGSYEYSQADRISSTV